MPGSAYDVLPYPSLPFPQTHPDRLAGIATLLEQDGRPVPDRAVAGPLVGQVLEEVLGRFVRYSLLTAGAVDGSSGGR